MQSVSILDINAMINREYDDSESPTADDVRKYELRLSDGYRGRPYPLEIECVDHVEQVIYLY